MKKTKFILVFILFANRTVFAQGSTDSTLSYSKVEYVDSTLKSSELFTRAREWFALTFRSSNDVIQLEDKQNGKLIGKGAFKYTSRILYGSEGTKGWVYYTLTIQVKDGRYKFDLTNFIHEGNPNNTGGALSFNLITTSDECPYDFAMSSKSWKNKVWKDIKQDIQTNSETIISSLKIAMSKPSPKVADEW